MAREQLEPLLEQLRRSSPITLGQPERCPDETGFFVGFELLVQRCQQPLRFLEPRLTDTQGDQPAQCADMKTRTVLSGCTRRTGMGNHRFR